MLLALCMVVLFGMLAFAVDTGYIMHARTTLQRTADACALAAVRHLPDTSAAKLTVYNVAVENGWKATKSELEALQTEAGYWDRDSASFTSPAPTHKPTNSIRVTLKRTRATGNPLNLFFGGVLGKSMTDVTATATAMCDRSLCGPFVGIESVDVPGTPDTDSYDSDEGWYVLDDAGDQGSVCSDGPIDVEGTAVIRGDARAGKHASVTVSNNAVVTGNVGNRIKPLNLPLVDASDAATFNDNADIPLIPKGKSFVSPVDAQGNFVLDGGNSITLRKGTYYFNDFTLAGNATLNIEGSVVIYVTGDLYRGGLVSVNNPGKPGDLKIYMTGGVADVTSGNDFYGVIYAPNTDVTIDGSAHFYGAVVGKTLSITGSGYAHYDESLDLAEVGLPTRTALVD